MEVLPFIIPSRNENPFILARDFLAKLRCTHSQTTVDKITKTSPHIWRAFCPSDFPFNVHIVAGGAYDGNESIHYLAPVVEVHVIPIVQVTGNLQHMLG